MQVIKVETTLINPVSGLHFAAFWHHSAGSLALMHGHVWIK